jgi:hypothetical protein
MLQARKPYGRYRSGAFSRSVKRSQLPMNANAPTPPHENWPRDRYGAGAAAIYLGFALLVFGRDLLGGLALVHFGHGPDPSQMIWLVAWWPHALAHRENPFISPNVWAPGGLNLTWAVGMPFASLALAPITASAGPIASYNLLCLICPVLAGWSAYLLVRHSQCNWLGSLFAGYIFGFSPYMLGALIGGHPYLLLTFPLPLLALATLKRYAGLISARTFTALAASLIVTEFLCSTEVAATMAVFGAIALILAWYLAISEEERARIAALITPLLLAGVIAAVFLIPYLYYMIAFGVPHGAINSPAAYSTDLLNFIWPTATVQIGNLSAFKAVAARFPGNTGEAGGYLAPPLILIVALYARAHWHETATRWLLLTLAVAAAAELGPRLHLAGYATIGMPWKLATHMPLLQNALPARFSLYASLIAAIVAALWLTRDGAPAWMQWALIISAVILSLPNLAKGAFTAPNDPPPFFASDLYRSYLKPDETVLVLPFSVTGNSMEWLARTNMYFRLAGGNSAIMPRDYEAWPIVNAFLAKTLLPNPVGQIEAFCAAHEVTTIAVEASHGALWAPALASLDASPAAAGGMIIYRVPEANGYHGIAAVEMERRADEARFAALTEAARVYLAGGGNAARLSPMEMQRRGLLPPHWVNDPDVRTKNGLYLGQLDHGLIGIGVVGSYAALRPLIQHYRPLAEQIYFPYPRELKGEPAGNTFMRLLVMAFTPAALANKSAASR